MKYEINDNKFEMVVDYSVSKNLKSFKEEVLDELYFIHKTNGEMPILFSGGMDSTFILRSLQTLGINPKLITFSWSKDNSDFFCQLAIQKSKKYGTAPPEFFYMDEEKFINHTNYIETQKKIFYPMLHGYFMDYFLSTTHYDKFYCGMQAEYKLENGEIIMPGLPALVKKNNPDRIYCFTSDKVFLSYFKHPLFLENYEKNNYIPFYGTLALDKWYVRDLIYQDCYPDMEKEVKFPDTPAMDYINMAFQQWSRTRPYRDPLNVEIPPCTFDAKFLIEV